MLHPSVRAVKELNTACQTLLHWQAEQAKGSTIATKLIPTWIDIVTKSTASAKVALMKLDLDGFIIHTQELVQYNIDTTAIQSIQLLADKPDFSSYSKLRLQLKMYQESSSYVLRRSGQIAEIATTVRTSQNETIQANKIYTNAITGKPNKPLPKLEHSLIRASKGDLDSTDLLKVVRKIQPAIDVENEARLKGRLIRQARQAEKKRQSDADKFLKSLLK
jgi:hypothetical protein